jgi:hypothetical protein
VRWNGLPVQRLKAWGLLEERGTKLKLTQAGRDTLRRLMARLTRRTSGDAM